MVAFVRHPLVRYSAAFIASAVVMIVLLQSSAEPVVGPAAPPQPKPDWEILLTAAHISASAGLTALWAWAFAWRMTPRRAICLAVLVALSLGVVGEIFQTFVPDRNPSWWDIGSDVVGVMVGAVARRFGLSIMAL